jgi:hypothetical protein
MYYIYPALLLIAIKGIVYIFDLLKHKNKGFLLRTILIVLIILGLLYPSYFMVRYHPYQNLYFNMLAGRNMKEVKENFEIDYWGLTFREGLEYILENDDREVIKISYGDAPGRRNSRIIKPADRGRIDYVNHPGYADYFIANYKYHRTEYLYEEEFYSISIGNAKVLVIYKLN